MSVLPQLTGDVDPETDLLLKSLLSLADQFNDLAKRLLTSVVEPLQKGMLPDLSVADECRAISNDYLATHAVAVAAGLPSAQGLGAMVATLRDRLTTARWKDFRAGATGLLFDVRRLAHTSGATPQYLIDAQTRATEMTTELDLVVSGADQTSWELRLKPFRDLWRLLTVAESLTEVEAEDALTQVEQAFGRAMMSAVATRKLVVNSQPSAEPETHPTTHLLPPQAQDDPEVSSTRSSYATTTPEPAGSNGRTTEPAVVSAPADSDNPKASESAGPHPHPAITPSPGTCDGPHAGASVPRGSFASTLTDPTDMRSVAVPTVGPSARTELTTRPFELPAGTDGPMVHSAVWELFGAGRASVAYHVADCWAGLGQTGPVEPSALFRAAALAPFVRSSFGEIVDEFRGCVADLGSVAGPTGGNDEIATARRLTLFGLSLRPALLAPAAGAASVLQFISMLDGPFPAIGRIRQAVAGFGEANVELSPSVLKGVRDHALWVNQLLRIRDEAQQWLLSNRKANIIYAPTTDVWHRWLRDDGPLGGTLQIVIGDTRRSIESARSAVKTWRNAKTVEKLLHDTDLSLRKNGARRRPIEARARCEICDRVQEFVRIVGGWLDHLAAEPHSLDDYRQRRADEVREEVSSALPDALTEIDRVAGAGTAFLAAAAKFVKRALNDLQHLFNPAHDESTEIPPVRVLLGEELLAVPDLDLTEEWCPVSPADAVRLRRLLLLGGQAYDPEAAFRTHTESRNHIRTGHVIEALHARGQQDLADRLQDERDEELRLCRKTFQQMLATTRANIEQAVCYDLIGGDDRSRYADAVEAYGAGLDDILNFGRAAADLQRIDAELAARRAARVALVRAKLDEMTREGVPADRQPDVEVIRSALGRGDFLSAEEYLQLIRDGQPLSRVADVDRTVLAEFFTGCDGRPGFVRRFDEYMTSPGRPREVIERVRRAESVGPIDMKGVAEPQAREAAGMVEAWLRLKDMREKVGGVAKELTALLAGVGFKGVAVESVSPAKPPHWMAVCRTAEVHNPADCIVPQYGSKAHGKYRVLGVYDRPNEESLVELAKMPGDEPPVLVLYFGRMTEQRRRDLAEFSRARGRGFLTIDESLIYFLCGERFSRLPVLFQCALPFTVAKPYTTTASLVPVEMFFGRQREREQLTAIDGTNLVYGGRQLGKSALLRDIERQAHNPAAGQIVRWIDLKNRGIGIDHPTEDIWAEIGKVLCEEGVLANPATAHRTVADRVREWLRADEGRRILLLLDEADAFFEMDSQAPVKVTRQSYPEVARLKGLMDDTNRRFKVVFAGLHNVQRAARDPNTPLGHLGTPVCIGPLLDNGEWRQARDLIEVPLRHMGYELSPPDLWMRILSYTNYYPSLIQVFCKHLLEFLHNKDQTTFNFRQCPPYPVTAELVERVYQSKSLRDEVSHKFELTLGLDPRYRLIALEIALDSLNHPGGRAEGVDVGWVRTQALADWPNGFVQTDRGYELFRTILDEMVGLGILRRAAEDRYALRSPNVLNLLGSREQIESKLLDVMGLPQPQVYDAATFRRSLCGNRWDHSPFTAEQEATLTEPANGVAVVFASRLAGLDRLTDGLHGIPNLAGVQVAGRMTQPAQFEAWLREVDEGRVQSEGVTLAVVPTSSSWTVGWLRRAGDILGKKKGSRKRFLRVVFVADPSTGWTWLSEEEVRALGAAEITVRPWHETALRRWVEEVEFNDPNRVCEAIRTHLGGWYSLVGEFAAACRDNPLAWPAVLDTVRTRWPGDPRWAGCCDIPAEARDVLTEMAAYGEPIRPDELGVLIDPAAVRRTLVWADRFAYAQRADDESGERWAVDPVVRAYLAGAGG